MCICFFVVVFQGYLRFDRYIFQSFWFWFVDFLFYGMVFVCSVANWDFIWFFVWLVGFGFVSPIGFVFYFSIFQYIIQPIKCSHHEILFGCSHFTYSKIWRLIFCFCKFILIFFFSFLFAPPKSIQEKNKWGIGSKREWRLWNKRDEF